MPCLRLHPNRSKIDPSPYPSPIHAPSYPHSSAHPEEPRKHLHAHAKPLRSRSLALVVALPGAPSTWSQEQASQQGPQVQLVPVAGPQTQNPPRPMTSHRLTQSVVRSLRNSRRTGHVVPAGVARAALRSPEGRAFDTRRRGSEIVRRIAGAPGGVRVRPALVRSGTSTDVASWPWRASADASRLRRRLACSSTSQGFHRPSPDYS